MKHRFKQEEWLEILVFNFEVFLLISSILTLLEEGSESLALVLIASLFALPSLKAALAPGATLRAGRGMRRLSRGLEGHLLRWPGMALTL